MANIFSGTVFLLAVICFAADAVPILGVKNKGVIPNEYIVKFHENTSDITVLKHAMNMREYDKDYKMMYHYNFGGFKGYAIRSQSDRLIQSIANAAEVEIVEANQEVHATQQCSVQTGATWGLVRTTERNLALNGLYSHKGIAGEGVVVYVIDTGIYIDHSDFEGRATFCVDEVDSPPESDLNGHGTHVAGTICGKTYGLAKKAKCCGVRVLDQNGSGSYAGVIAGINWVGENKGTSTAIANMSLGGGKSNTMNAAVDALVAQGVLMVVAAGNEAQDACNVSPASASQAFVVACSDTKDEMCYFSNYGTCVNIIAPGMSILSAWIGGQYADNTISGTSMSSPHVAGVAAKILSENPSLTVDQLKQEIMTLATSNKITEEVGSGTDNKLIFKDCA